MDGTRKYVWYPGFFGSPDFFMRWGANSFPKKPSGPADRSQAHQQAMVASVAAAALPT
jgi:hypothetical protein